MPNRKLFRNRELNSGREKLADTAQVAETQRWQLAVFLKLPDRALSGDVYIHTSEQRAGRPKGRGTLQTRQHFHSRVHKTSAYSPGPHAVPPELALRLDLCVDGGSEACEKRAHATGVEGCARVWKRCMLIARATFGPGQLTHCVQNRTAARKPRGNPVVRAEENCLRLRKLTGNPATTKLSAVTSLHRSSSIPKLSSRLPDTARAS